MTHQASTSALLEEATAVAATRRDLAVQQVTVAAGAIALGSRETAPTATSVQIDLPVLSTKAPSADISTEEQK